ncbi:MAG TPA: hypothetical protein VFQ13_00710 [Anaerolineales bacterium]|nr:hypothetical protein [Anaerolineales bacterium]
MKFTDGYWQMRPGMKSHDATIEGDVLTIYAPTRKLQGRGATISSQLSNFPCTLSMRLPTEGSQ